MISGDLLALGPAVDLLNGRRCVVAHDCEGP